MIQLPNNKKCYNLPEQVSQNLLNIQYLAEQYKNIDELPSIWADYKTAFDADLHTFEDWTTTFEGWENTLATYLANMSSAAVGAIAGQNIAPANVNATTKVDAPLITGDEIVEKMSGYSATLSTQTNWLIEKVYISAVKNGNKLTFVVALNLTKLDAGAANFFNLGSLTIPSAIGEKLYPATVGLYQFLDNKVINAFSSYDNHVSCPAYIAKSSDTLLLVTMGDASNFVVGTKYYFRYEATFLLNDSL